MNNLFILLSSHGGGGGIHNPISLEDVLQPFIKVWEWARTYRIHFVGYTFTFNDMWMWYIGATLLVIVFWAILERRL